MRLAAACLFLLAASAAPADSFQWNPLRRAATSDHRASRVNNRVVRQRQPSPATILAAKDDDDDDHYDDEEEAAMWEAELAEQMRRNRGTGGWWVLCESHGFEKNFTEDTSCVAIGSNGVHLCLYDSGSWAYSTGLPDDLHKLLHTRALSHSSPDYVAMGSMNRYYIRFKNGKSQWVGPDNLSELLQKDKRRVKSVAFGEGHDNYFVVFEGGGYQYAGCPIGLQEKIKARRSRGDLDKVTLGPNGEWGLWAKNGRAWWGGLDDSVADKISSHHKQGDSCTDLLFSNDGYYFMRYQL